MLIEDTGRTIALLPENAPRRHHWLSRICIVESVVASVAACLGEGPLLDPPDAFVLNMTAAIMLTWVIVAGALRWLNKMEVVEAL